MDAASCIRFTHLLAGISNPMSPKGKSSHDNEGLPRLFHLPSPHRSLKYLLTNGDNSPHSRPVKLVLFHLPLMFRPYPLAIKTGGLDSLKLQFPFFKFQPKRHQFCNTKAQPGFIIMLLVCGNCYTADLSRPSACTAYSYSTDTKGCLTTALPTKVGISG